MRLKVSQVVEAAGLSADDGLNPLFSPDLVIATTAQALTRIAVPEHWVLIGAALGPRRTDPDFPWDRWDSGRRHVLVTAGTLSAHLVEGFLARMMKALGSMASQVQAVVNAAPDAVPEPTPNVLLIPRIPMLDLMPRVDAVVCQAGQSTVNEALVHGVPLVVAPIRLGELATADQVVKAGAGVAVSMLDASADQLAGAITAVLDDPGYRARAGRMAREFEGRRAGHRCGRRPLGDTGASRRVGRPGLASDCLSTPVGGRKWKKTGSVYCAARPNYRPAAWR